MKIQLLEQYNKKNTRNKIIQLRKRNPKWTLQQIANECNISKQRVHYILKSENLPTKIFNKSWGKGKYKNCHFCKSLMPRNTGINYCNNMCRDNDLFINYPCSFCHENIKINRKVMMKKVNKLQQYNFFCGRKCYGKFKSCNKS